jgi:hypothetical protein
MIPGERKPGRHNAPPNVSPTAPPVTTATTSDFHVTTRDPAALPLTPPNPERAAPCNPRPARTREAWERTVGADEIAAAVVGLRRAAGREGGRRKLFVPTNAALYNAAFIGYVGGTQQARTIGSATTGLVAQAVLFAQAVDGDIPFDGGLTQSKIDLLTDIVSNVFGDVYPMGLDEVDYAAQAAEVVALYNEAVPLLAATAPPGGGITQLIGDVLAGPGVGTQSATTAGLRGTPILDTPPVAGLGLVYNGTDYVPGLASIGPLSSLLYVDRAAPPGGNGSIANPYQSIAAASADFVGRGAITSADRYGIMLAPGIYDELVALLPWIFIIGTSPYTTKLTGEISLFSGAPNYNPWNPSDSTDPDVRGGIIGVEIAQAFTIDFNVGATAGSSYTGSNEGIVYFSDVICDGLLTANGYSTSNVVQVQNCLLSGGVNATGLTVQGISTYSYGGTAVNVQDSATLPASFIWCDGSISGDVIITSTVNPITVYTVGTSLVAGLTLVGVGVTYTSSAEGVPVAGLLTLENGANPPVLLNDGGSLADPNTPSNTVAASLAAVFGTGVVGQGNSNAAIGFGGVTAGGTSNNVSGYYSVIVGGQSVEIDGQWSGAVGGQTNYSGGLWGGMLGGQNHTGDGSHFGLVGGDGNTTNANYCAILGGSTLTADADYSIMFGFQGVSAVGTHEGALVGCGGSIILQQAVWPITLYGTTAGAAPGETAVLVNQLAGSVVTSLPDGCYSIQVNCIVTDVSDVASWVDSMIVQVTGGVAAIVSNISPTPTKSSAGASTWTLVPSVTGSDNTLPITFADGISTAICDIVCVLSWAATIFGSSS